MTKYVLLFFLMLTSFGFSQNKVEREHRILKSQFPATQYTLKELGDGVKKIKYYKEVDSAKTVYSKKFKKRRLHYQMYFTPEGLLTAISFNVTETDIESGVFENIITKLTENHDKLKVLKMQQLYKVTSQKTEAKTVKSAFQNLILPSNIFKITVKTKTKGKKRNLIYFFNAKGYQVAVKDVLPTNHDRVLY